MCPYKKSLETYLMILVYCLLEAFRMLTVEDLILSLSKNEHRFFDIQFTDYNSFYFEMLNIKIWGSHVKFSLKIYVPQWFIFKELISTISSDTDSINSNYDIPMSNFVSTNLYF